jgi:hypothetical protein
MVHAASSRTGKVRPSISVGERPEGPHEVVARLVSGV